MSLIAMAPALVLWLLGRNSFARLFGVEVRRVLFLDGPTGRRVLATAGGSASAALLAIALMLILYELAGALGPPVPAVGGVVEGMPAAQAGLAPGDEILTIGGQPVKSLADVSQMIDRTQGKPVTVDVLRDGERRQVTLRAKQENDRWRIGLELEEKQQRMQLTFVESARRASHFPADYSRAWFSSLWRIVAGSSRAELSGPIGIVRQQRKAAPELSLDLVFSLPAMGAVQVAWLGLPLGFLLLAFGRSRRSDERA
jgi:regulator of sigma E protease